MTSARPVVIGVTGPIGCGKSTVVGWLAAEPGVVAIDADALARDVLAPGTRETAAVLDRFGRDLRAEDGSLDRAALGRIVFADPAALRDLEAIVHPAVRPRVRAAMTTAERDGARAVLVEAIKLVEGGLAELCDEVWLLTCEAGIQVDRVVGRGLPLDAARARIAAQADLEARVRPRADRVIDTSGDATATRRAALAALEAAIATTTTRSSPEGS